MCALRNRAHKSIILFCIMHLQPNPTCLVKANISVEHEQGHRQSEDLHTRLAKVRARTHACTCAISKYTHAGAEHVPSRNRPAFGAPMRSKLQTTCSTFLRAMDQPNGLAACNPISLEPHFNCVEHTYCNMQHIWLWVKNGYPKMAKWKQ